MATGGEIFLSFLFTVFIFLDFAGNVLILLTVRRSTAMQTPMNLLIANVAITDIVIAIFAFPRHAINHALTLPKGDAGKYLCKFITGGGFIWVSNVTCGVLLMTIASERFLAVVFPLKKNLRVTIKKIKYLVPIFWLYGLVVTIPTIWVQEYYAERDFCMENFPNNTSPQAYVGFIFTINCVIPIIVLTSLYACIVTSLWRKGNRATDAHATQAARNKARKKVTRLLITITSLHLVCWVPNYVTYLMVHVAPRATPPYGSVWYNITVLLILFNSAANPFCYCVLMRNFKKGVLSLVCWWHKNRKIEVSQRADETLTIQLPTPLPMCEHLNCVM